MSLCLAGKSAAEASSISTWSTLGITFETPRALSKMNAEGATSTTKLTECVQFAFRRSKQYAGEVCTSSDPDFIRERGVISYDTVPEGTRSGDRPESGLMIASALMQYPLEPFVDQPVRAYAATVDCDDDAGTVYRPTASCHVAVAPLRDGTVAYSNFLVKRHTANTPGLSVNEIKKLWSSMRSGEARSTPQASSPR